uniref:hypothetical protein n=1 Tax=Pedobacter schmidteae TaxID=2201271 RepID=UPI000EB0ED0F|nr:hypothetical protein [Pedobacter schmidteae]
MLDQTEIFALNLESEEIKLLSDGGIKVYEGSAGYLTSLSYGNRNTLQCLPNFDLPSNFHEYQVGILDLTNENRVAYSLAEHEHKNTKTNDHAYLFCEKPQDLFDPRPFSLFLFGDNFQERFQNGFLLIIFCSEDTAVRYTQNRSTYFYKKPYDFLRYAPQTSNRIGKKTKIPKEEGDLFTFLKKYNDKFHYAVTFDLPDKRINGEYVPDPEYTPLVLTNDDKIAGCSWHNDQSGIFFFPKLDNKAKFLEEFLTEVAPTIFPHLFPDIIKDKWLEQDRYHLPNQNRLLEEKRKLKKEFDAAMSSKNVEIEENKMQFQFLTQMITKTGDELVDSVLQFVQWLGFESAVDADKERVGTLKEEDIKIETDLGLIIIEVKGIGGVPSDSDCSQIGKVRTRRQKERKSFEVFGLFVVNHERHKPAATRLNPPFSNEQLNDANYDDRGLITTWQLFNIYHAIENGILTKDQIKKCFYRQGYLDFIPDGMINLGVAAQVYSKISVIILILNGTVALKPGDKLLYKIGDEFKTVTIESIKFNEEEVQSANNGEFGLKLNELVPKTAELYAYS